MASGNEDSDQQPCSSKSFTPSHERPRHKTPSHDRAPTALRRVEWETLERNWSGHSSSGATWRNTNKPTALPPIPKPQYHSKKGKGVGKGRRNLERASTSAGSMSSGQSSSSSLAGVTYQGMSANSTMVPGYEEDYAMDLSFSSVQNEPMDLSINEPSSVDYEQDSKNLDLEIDEPFEDTVAIAGYPVSLTCKVNGNPKNFKWFKNGQEIEFDSRIQALIDEEYQTFTLKIHETTRHDLGVYKFEVSNRHTLRICRGKLFVGVDLRTSTSICTGLCPRYALDVSEQLKHVTVFVGESFELSATFVSKRIGDFRWFKNDRVLVTDHRCIISSTENNSTLNVMRSKMTDTGIYIVVIKTKFGITSSWTDVQVFDNIKMNELIKYESAPYIEEMPIDTNAHEGEEVRLLCKVRSNSRSAIRWDRFDKYVNNRNCDIVRDYGDTYISMRIHNVRLIDAGKYGIQLKDILTGQEKVESCTVSVFHDTLYKVDVKVIRPLLSSVMIYGATLTLDCKFDVSHCTGTQFFVVWYIGHHKVTLTDSRFKVECKNGVCLLKIMKMEPGMTGEAACELRTPLSYGKSVVRALTTCNLAIVPSSVLSQDIALQVRNTPCEIMCVEYSIWSNEGLVGIADTGMYKCGFHVNQPPLPLNHILFYMEYCRLEDDNYYYLNIQKKTSDNKLVVLSVRESQALDPAEPGLLIQRTIKIEWEYQGSNTYTDHEIWYRVDFRMPDGYYMHIAITSRPRLVFNNPRINESAHFRITTMIPDHITRDADVSITHRSNDPGGLPLSFIPRPLSEYCKRYQTQPGTIGAGAYGSVCVARRHGTGVDYAVKTILFKSIDHKETCNREIHLLKSLRHEKIVVMVDAYRDFRQAKLVMECLWGGELFERIASSSHVVESDVIIYVRQICDALIYLHEKSIVHLDVKPENIMCVHPNSRQVKLVDFGLARKLNAGYRTTVLNGTRNYVSPEILNFEQLTVVCDLWSLGVVTYMLLSGIPPFIADTWLQESVKIIQADYNYEDRAFRDVSGLAKDFIDKLLVVDANKRWTAKQASGHPWLREGPHKQDLKNLKKTKTTKSRWQKARIAMIAAQRFRMARIRQRENPRIQPASPMMLVPGVGVATTSARRMDNQGHIRRLPEPF